MSDEEVRKLKHGLYVIFWDGAPSHPIFPFLTGGISVAAVGSNSAGAHWYAPTNWIHVPSFDWGCIKSVRLITTQAAETERAAGRPAPLSTTAILLADAVKAGELDAVCGLADEIQEWVALHAPK